MIGRNNVERIISFFFLFEKSCHSDMVEKKINPNERIAEECIKEAITVAATK